ncbi:MAG: outer membrane protein assembly factor BamC, partial [Gammaproteobacteria bacterium]|nr:outer membrane protein assembly factor BamC [Gammaproteobacteria bacterium]
PPDLTQSILSERFDIPDNFSAGTGETINQIPVLAQVDTLRLEGSADFYWLSVEGSVDNLYELIKAFWAAEGFTLEKDEPVIGIMQTDWVFKEEGIDEKELGIFEKLFGNKNLSNSQDQFRTRIARDADDDKTRIYITHRGTRNSPKESTVQSETDVASEWGIQTKKTRDDWGFRPSEPELEVEMLSRLMIFLGLQQSDVEQQVSNIKLFQPRALMQVDNSENETYLLVRATPQQTWNRLLHELSRLDIEVLSTNEDRGFSGDRVAIVRTNYQIEEKSGFFSFFNKPRTVDKEIALVVSKETHNQTRISIENLSGDFDQSGEAIEFLTTIYERVK